VLSRPSRVSLRFGARLALLACGLVMPGCAGGLAGTWADFQTRREIETAAADDSFPDAAEAGVLSASADSKPSKPSKPSKASQK